MGWFGVRSVAVSAVVAVAVTLLPAVGVADAVPGLSLPGVRQPKAVPVKPLAIGGRKRPNAAATHWKAPKVSWPGAGHADISPAGSAVRAGSLPVRVAASGAAPRAGASRPSAVRVTVADHAAAQRAGVDGLLLSVGRTDGVKQPGPVRVQVDYASFRGAYGGDWASRLRLVRLPACALTTPEEAACQVATPVETTNDTTASTLSAQVTAAASGATVLAAESGASGSSGTYTATSLQPSGSWSAGDSTGAFSWSYPMSAPAVPGGLQPSVSLGYNSQGVDGQTSASNNQPSWIGDGWAYEPGFVERRYKSCDDDKTGGTNTTKVGDLCWYNDNATLSLGGKSTELVHDATTGWHPADDSGEKVEKLTGAVNGDNDGEYWKITTTDGTQYYFGLNRLPGWTGSTTPETNSAWTEPVFGNQTGEPCYNSSFAAAWCQQAWRWQLDYVTDVHGNAMAYYWNKETNNYGRDVNATTGASTVTPYTRGGYLDHIDYGLRSNAVYAGKAMGKVLFGTSERCLTGCDTFDTAHAANWPDTPVDQNCKDGATKCADQYSPTFWSRKRLTLVTTQVLTGGAYKNVDSWKLDQGFPPAGDGISTPLWLNSVTRGSVNSAGTFTALLPPVTFSGEQLANRVDKTGDALAPFVRLRMSQITTETGGTIGVYYNDPGCTATSLPTADADNTTTCYPVKWPYEGDTAKLDWFNSYPVKQVVESDNLAATPDKVTSYAYVGGAAWAKSTDEFSKADDRTYSVQRGYGLVQTRTGAGLDPLTLGETRYFRGVDGAAVKDSAGVAVTDREQFAGMVRESATYNGDDAAKLVSATSYTPWRSAATATRTRTGLPDLVAYHTGTSDEQTRTTVTGGTRTTSVHSTFDSYGMVSTSSSTGDTAKSGDESCTTTTYTRNTTSWLLDLVAETRTTDRTCDVTPALPADLNADTRTYYDGATSVTAAPTKGDVTKVEQIKGSGSGYDQVSAVPAGEFDLYGRPLSVADAFGKTTTTVYTPTTGEVPTKAVVTNPLGQTVTTTLDPLRGQPLTVTDANSRVTTTTYDALGRVTQVWTPARAQSAYPTTPSCTFGYTIRNDGPVVVTTKALNYQEVYQPSYAFYDGMLRPYQTQAPSPDGSGRLVTETLYDTRGLAWRTSGTYYADGSPEAVPVTGQELHYPASTDTAYDGAGRVVSVTAKKFGDPAEVTTSTYTGDSVTVVPPPGGTATTTVLDALGRTTELKEYTNAARTSSQSTLSAYDAHGRLAQVTDPTGAKWTYTYDTRGRQITANDPDKGPASVAYDAGDRVTDTTDARGYRLHSDYDALGRPTQLTSTYQGTTTTLSAWTYDTATGGVGQPAKSTQYVDGQPYTSEVTSYSSLYLPAASRVTIPGTVAPAGTYAWTTAYYFTGQVKWTRQPAIGGLPQEDVTPLYTSGSALPVTLAAGSDPVVSNTVYDHYGRDAREEFGAFNQKVYTSYEYDDHTGALTDQITDRDTAPQRIDAAHYTYDQAGNVTSIGDTTGQDAGAVTDTQCFGTDALRRVTQAWTLNGGSHCADGPSAATVGGPDAYWTSYSYDPVGNRTTETQHATTAGPAADTTRTYAAPDTGTHDLPRVTQTGSNPHTDTYTYDADGNTTTRTLGSAPQQSLAWDPQGHLASVTQGTTTLASYTYDTAGNRLTSTDATGTTLYLPGGNELLLKPDGTLTGTRYYDFNGKTVALRSGGKIVYLVSDPHGTATTQIDAATQAVTRRKTTIFGATRGSSTTGWQGTKGFVGGTTNAATGLTHLGAREYDPSTGRFISVDPVLDLTNPQQMNGYTYANANPVTYADPSGLRPLATDSLYDEDAYNKKNNAFWTNTSKGGWTYNQVHSRTDDRDTWVAVVSIPTHGQTSITVAHFRAKPKPPPSITRQTWNFFKSAGKQTLKVFNPASLLSASEMVLGLMATEVGVGGDLLGGTACATGALCLVGAPAVFASSTLAAAGVTLLGKGANDLINSERTALSDSSEGSSACSFTPDTRVLMSGGKTKRIEDIKKGDDVEAADPDNGKHKGPRKVTATHVNHDSDLADVTIRDSSGRTSTIRTTSLHRFWDDTTHTWVRAGALVPGHSLITATGRHVSVAATYPLPAPAADMYNLTVDDLHTYYVLAGTTPILVHNTGQCPNGVADSWNEGTFDSPEDSFQYHYNKHGAPANVTPEQYLQDSNNWAQRLTKPGGKAGLNAKRMPFDNGQFGVKYSDPHGGAGGIIGPDGKVVSFWYADAY